MVRWVGRMRDKRREEDGMGMEMMEILNSEGYSDCALN